MPTIKSRWISGTQPTPETMRRVHQELAVAEGEPLNLMVFEVDYDQKKYYCCWSGGSVVSGELRLTLIGKASMEALANLPWGRADSLVFIELQDGGLPLRNKIKGALKRLPAKSRVCFFGDVAGKLKHQMHDAFNVLDETITAGH